MPVPRWSGVRPYEQIPFQWSCHIEHRQGVFEHHNFLDLTGKDPSLECIKRMCEVIRADDNGPIFVYYATYEKGRLKEFGQRHPEFERTMDSYIARLFDLHPLVKSHFYHPAMRGSFSIKKEGRVCSRIADRTPGPRSKSRTFSRTKPDRCDLVDGKIGAGDGNRTHVSSLGSYSSTIELHPRGEARIAEPQTPSQQNACPYREY